MKLAHTPQILTDLPDRVGDQAPHPDRDDNPNSEKGQTHNQGISGRLLNGTIDLLGWNHHGKIPRPSTPRIEGTAVHHDWSIADEVMGCFGGDCGAPMISGWDSSSHRVKGGFHHGRQCS